MKIQNAFSQANAASEQQDDIGALSHAFSIDNFDYIDIARDERLVKITARWPLLSELASDEAEHKV